MTAQTDTAGTDGPPVFVVGFPRSGTTLLQALLGAHPNIAAPPEMHYFRRIPLIRDYWGDLADDEVLRRVVDATVNPPTGVLAEAGFDVDRIVGRVRQGPRTYATVLDAVMRDFADQRGKARWCEKSPLQHPRVIWGHFPDAQLVHIVRDPRATVASNKDKLGLFADAATTARLWRQYTLEAAVLGAERGPARYLRLRYEDLTRDPEAVLRVVFAFLREDFDPAVLTDLERRRATVPSMAAPWQSRALQPVQAAPVDAWRSLLSRPERLRVAAIVGPLLPLLGYPPARRAAAVGGAGLNAVAAPADIARLARVRLHEKRLRTPEQRYEETLRVQQQMLDQMEHAVTKRG